MVSVPITVLLYNFCTAPRGIDDPSPAYSSVYRVAAGVFWLGIIIIRCNINTGDGGVQTDSCSPVDVAECHVSRRRAVRCDVTAGATASPSERRYA